MRCHTMGDDSLVRVRLPVRFPPTLKYDLETKARLYAANGIRKYWVADLLQRLARRRNAIAAKGHLQVPTATGEPMMRFTPR